MRLGPEDRQISVLLMTSLESRDQLIFLADFEFIIIKFSCLYNIALICWVRQEIYGCVTAALELQISKTTTMVTLL